MADDPIVTETRALREQMMNEAGADLDSLVDFLRNEQEHFKERLVRLPSRQAIPLATPIR